MIVGSSLKFNISDCKSLSFIIYKTDAISPNFLNPIILFLTFLYFVVIWFKDMHFSGAVFLPHSLYFVNHYETYSEHCQVWPTQSAPLQGGLEPLFISCF